MIDGQKDPRNHPNPTVALFGAAVAGTVTLIEVSKGVSFETALLSGLLSLAFLALALVAQRRIPELVRRDVPKTGERNQPDEKDQPP
jgi:hypothetical protein